MTDDDLEPGRTCAGKLHALIARTMGRPVDALRLIGRGTDHVVYDIDGTLLARIATELDGTTATSIERETRLLAAVSAISPIPVPTVVAADPAAGLTVTTRLSGTSLLDEPCPHPEQLAGPLAGLLAALAGIEHHRLVGIVEPDHKPLDERLAEATDTLPRIADTLNDRQRHLVENFLRQDAPADADDDVVLCHNDLGAEHILAAPNCTILTGIIDWSDAALTDPAVDLGRLLRDLGPTTVELIVDRLGLDPETVIARAAFYARCALFEDLDYGLSTPDRRYSAAALSHLARSFEFAPAST